MKAQTSNFKLGRVSITDDARYAFRRNREYPFTFLKRHASGDWGDVKRWLTGINQDSIAGRSPFPICSIYRLKDGTGVWVITDQPRTLTIISLRPGN